MQKQNNTVVTAGIIDIVLLNLQVNMLLMIVVLHACPGPKRKKDRF